MAPQPAGKPPAEVNHGARPNFPEKETVLDQLHRQVSQRPSSVALVVPEGENVDGVRLEVTYAEMWKMILQTAQELSAVKAKQGSQWIIVVLPQGLQQVIAVWGVLRAGCGYVPLDADTQAPRLQIIFPEVDPTVAIGEAGATALRAVAGELKVPLGTYPKGASHPQGLVVEGAERFATAEIPGLPALGDFALLLFSSGSTGVPKGIIYDHTWLMGCAYFVAADHLELTPRSRTLLRCSYVWSVGLYDFFPVNLVGGTLFIPPKGGHMNVQYMAETIERETIHAVVIQPTLLNLLLDEHRSSAGYPLRSLKHVISSGEKLFTSTVDTFVRAPGIHAKLWNMYGATEAGCTYFVAETGHAKELLAYPDGVPAGIPQPYVDVWVMAETGDPKHPLRPVPTGEVGEIVFGGGGKGFLSRGYWRNKALTDEKFLTLAGFGRLYRTGDAGAWEGGQLLVKGRLDRQVKVRGVRIQPEEIEARLKGYSNAAGDMPIKACLVVPSMHEPIELTAFLQTGDGQAVDEKAVVAFLKQELGKVYVPQHVVHLPDGLPRTASGKPDQNALRRLAVSREDVVGSATADPEQTNGAGDESASVLLRHQHSGTHHSWEVDLRGRLWKFVRDHRYKSEQLFPGSGYISLAAEACSFLWPTWELQDLKFSKPLPLVPPRPLRVTAAYTPGAPVAEIRISSLPVANGEWLLHCECRGVRVDVPREPFRVQPPPRGASERPVEQLYSELADGGFDYGPEFQALRSVYLGAGVAGGVVAHRQESAFLMDPVEIDACFQLAPLVSPLGYQGAPIAVKRVEYLSRCPAAAGELEVNVSSGADGMDFIVACAGSATCVLRGLELQVFDASTPEILHLTASPYSVPASLGAAPTVVAVGAAVVEQARELARVLGADNVCTWELGPLQLPGIARSIALVVRGDVLEDSQVSGLQTLLPDLCHELPYKGRVWLVIVGEDRHWSCHGRTWAALFPSLCLSIFHTQRIGESARVLLDSSAPALLSEEKSWRLVPTPSQAKLRFAGLDLVGGTVAVLSSEATALADALLAALREAGATAEAFLPCQELSVQPTAVVLCAVSPGSVVGFEAVCQAADQCVTICSGDAFIPCSHSGRALAASQAASASWRRTQAGHKSWVIFAPPLMEGLWFEPPAPAGFHRCSVKSFVAALAHSPAADIVIGLPEEFPKHWRSILSVAGGAGHAARSAAELRAFLVSELASSLGLAEADVDVSRTLEELGVGSLASLKLSQRLRRFIGKEISAFALQGNPTLASLISSLGKQEATATAATRGKVLCLHGFRTSSTILTQQMAPLLPILQALGYEPLVPNAPHISKGPAQGAAGLDDDDSFGWWTYDGESHDSAPLGLDKTDQYLQTLGPVVGVIGFSQGGAVAARVANALKAKWALLFSPVHVPGQPAQVDCPTLVAMDPAEEVHSCTLRLLRELPASTQTLVHHEGHRLPKASPWWEQVATFLEAQTPDSGEPVSKKPRLGAGTE